MTALLGWERARALPAAAWSAGCVPLASAALRPICDFDWSWPKRCDRVAVDALMTLEFLGDATNVVLVGQNGVGKYMLANNIAHQALIEGHTVLFTMPDNCSVISRHWIAMPPCAAVCAITPVRSSWSSMRSAMASPTPIATPT